MRKLTLGSAIKITGCLLTKTTVDVPFCSGLEYGGCLVTKSCLTLATPQTVLWQAPLSMGFSRQEYWSGLPFPSPGDFPHPEIKPLSSAFRADSLPSEPPGKPTELLKQFKYFMATGQGNLSFLLTKQMVLPVGLHCLQFGAQSSPFNRRPLLVFLPN